MPTLPQAEPRAGRAACVLAACLTIAACTSSTSGDGTTADLGAARSTTILALGDSILDFHVDDGDSIPDVIGRTLDRPVVNAAVGGAWFAHADPEAASAGLDVRAQYEESRAAADAGWVVLTGGGNDVNDACGCGRCDDVLDALISHDGTSGEIPDFARRVVADGSQLMYVGYAEISADAEGGFGRCVDELSEHGRRLAEMAESIDGVHFADARQVVTAADQDAYLDDLVHPSVEGAETVGRFVADEILAAEYSSVKEVSPMFLDR
ncbi:MAG: SGNH/GDSL hydrolase family protein [Actinomycetota bacterium]